MSRKAGVLLGVSMLPNEYGIGGFGEEALEFAQRIRTIGFKDWQVLPLTTIGMGNSPYSGVSAFAGNYLFIDPKRLVKSGLIDEAAAHECVYDGSIYTVDYQAVKHSKRRLIEGLVGRINTEDYLKKEGYWLNSYAEYMVLKDLNGERPWFEWDEKLRNCDREAVDAAISECPDRKEYYVLEQYLFDMQWQALKAELNAIDINVIGDMPIYVSHDSADVWAHRELFKLNPSGNPAEVAGVPPDYFSKDGQLWGNPLYDYDAMARDNYQWFVMRGKRMSALYDTLRIDHFRAFDRYWSVPYGSATAKEGRWVKADGEKLLRAVMKACPGLELIAEDLGIVDEGVIELREKLGLPGMRVLQFGLYDPNSTNCPHNFEKNTVAYTGTHDNTTAYAWLYELRPDLREQVYNYIGAPAGLEGGAYSKQIYALIRTLMTSVAERAIIPFQDLCGWGGDTRTNIPGVADGNWKVRITNNALNSINTMAYNELLNITGRL